MGFHPITGWFGINNVIGWVGFNFLLVFLVGCGMDIKVIRFGYGWEWIGFFAISGPMLLQQIGLAGLAPQPSNVEFLGWSRDTRNFISSSFKDGLNSLVILGAWTLWRHRNDCVFNGVKPNISTIMIM
jgi:hypothetical protein